jgi:hypothetical protein
MGSLIDLKELERRIENAQVQVSEAEAEVANAKRVLSALYAIRNNARVLDIDLATFAATAAVGTHWYDQKSMDVVSPSGEVVIPGEVIGRKKIRSTEMVAELVNEQPDFAWSREAIHDGFEQRFGIPDSWSNPANALNNAIARAVAKGLIDEADGYYSSPMDANQGGPVG